MKYLTAEDIIKINVMVIGKYSPKEPVGVADPNSLQMIIEQPKQEIFGKILYPDIYSKAAIIWINLIKKTHSRTPTSELPYLLYICF